MNPLNCARRETYRQTGRGRSELSDLKLIPDVPLDWKLYQSSQLPRRIHAEEVPVDPVVGQAPINPANTTSVRTKTLPVRWYARKVSVRVGEMIFNQTREEMALIMMSLPIDNSRSACPRYCGIASAKTTKVIASLRCMQCPNPSSV